MKFMKFALASAAVFGMLGVAFADDVVADLVLDGFEATADVKPLTGYNAAFAPSGAEAVWFGGSENDDTAITAYDDDAYAGTAAGMVNAQPGDLATGSTYLKISNSAPLWRLFNEFAAESGTGTTEDPYVYPTEFPGEGVTAADGPEEGDYVGGLFIDTLVQFTASEEAPALSSNDDKLIVWMNSESNLCVTAGKYTNDPSFDSVKTDFVTSTTVEPGKWYRLTVAAFNDLGLGSDSALWVHGFTVSIDGQVVAATEATMDASMRTALDEWCYPEVLDLIDDNKLFTSLMVGQESCTLAAVGFKGEGAVDSLAVSFLNPFSAEAPVGGLDFTLTWGEGVSAVWYSIDGGTTQNDVTKDAKITVPVDSTVTLGATAAPWYVLGTLPTVDAAGDYEVTASLATTPTAAGCGPKFAGVPVADVMTWANGAAPSAITDATFDKFLMNVAPDATTEPTLTITDIVEVEDGWQLTVAANTTLAGINGKVCVKAADTLDDLATVESLKSFDVTTDDDGKAITVVPAENGSFFKATVEYVPAPTAPTVE